MCTSSEMGCSKVQILGGLTADFSGNGTLSISSSGVYLLLLPISVLSTSDTRRTSWLLFYTLKGLKCKSLCNLCSTQQKKITCVRRLKRGRRRAKKRVEIVAAEPSCLVVR